MRKNYFFWASFFLLFLSVFAFSDNLFYDVKQESNSDPKFIIHGLFFLAWFIILVIIFAALFSLSEFKKRSEKFRNWIDRTTLKAPIVGDIVYQAAVARYARTLATTFAAGVPLVEALDSVAGATGNIVFKDAVLKIKHDVTSGMQLNFSMRSTGVFPSMAIQMTAIGEESGALDTMLDKVASYYEAEVDNAVDGLTALMEPLIMSVLGVLVGGLIIAMYLPIFQLGSVV